jgi:hypothetical protein
MRTGHCCITHLVANYSQPGPADPDGVARTPLHLATSAALPTAWIRPSHRQSGSPDMPGSSARMRRARRKPADEGSGTAVWPDARR